MNKPAVVDVVDAYMSDLLARVPANDAPDVAPAPPVPAPLAPAPPAPAAAAPPAPAPVAPPVPAAAQAAEPQGGRRRASDRIERWIGFSVAGQNFGVEVLQVLEVQRLSEITPVPGAAEDLLGAINLRGQIVSVLDLGRRLGFAASEPTDLSRIIIVDYRGQAVGLRVDGVAEVITASVSSVEAPPALGGRIAGGWIRGVLRHKGDTVLLLDPIRLLADADA